MDYSFDYICFWKVECKSRRQSQGTNMCVALELKEAYGTTCVLCAKFKVPPVGCKKFKEVSDD